MSNSPLNIRDKTLSGMTGFARLEANFSNTHWSWEARSVNGRGLDMRFKLPQELIMLEASLRKIGTKIFNRGNIQVNLSFQNTKKHKNYAINETLFDSVCEFIHAKGETVRASEILTIPSMIEEGPSEALPIENEDMKAELLKSYEKALQALKTAREVEGQAIFPVLMQAITSVETAIDSVETIAKNTPNDLQNKLEAKLSTLEIDTLDPVRLAQEVAFLAMKVDITEEIDRLRAHCIDGRKLLQTGSPIGRKLEFLAQEFNREINTLCSKSSDIDLTRLGLDMKTYIEQFREQSANVE